MPESFPLRPRGLRDLLDDSFHLYKAHFLKLLAPSAAVCLALQALGALFVVPAVPPSPSPGASADLRDGMTLLGILGLATLAYFVSLGWTASILHRQLIPLSLRDPQARPASFPRRWIGYLFTFSLVTGFYVLGVVFFTFLAGYVGIALIGLIPGYGILVYPWVCLLIFLPLTLSYGSLLTLALPVAVIEGRMGFSALKRGGQVFFADVRKAVLIRLLLLALFCGTVALLGGGIELMDPSTGADPDVHLSPTDTGVMFALFGVGQALVLPVYLTTMLLLYYDVRIRKEGWDLEQVVEGLESRRGTGSKGDDSDAGGDASESLPQLSLEATEYP